jgi:hypothetical protein
MSFDRFSPFGMWGFTSRPSPARQAYDALRAGYGEGFALTGHHEATLYAKAMALGRTMSTLERAGNQRRGATATEMLPNLERDYRIYVPETATLPQRRATVSARQLLVRGGTAQVIRRALTELLGTDFINYLPYQAEFPPLPEDPTTGPGLFTDPAKPPLLYQFLESVTQIGVPFTFAYQQIGKAPATPLAPGNVVVAQPENNVLAEKITITAVGTGTATATFARAKEAGAALRIGPFPWWISNVRRSYVIVTEAAAADPNKVREIHEIMSRLARGVSVWNVVTPRTPTTLGPFRAGDPAGRSPIGTVPL